LVVVESFAHTYLTVERLRGDAADDALLSQLPVPQEVIDGAIGAYLAAAPEARRRLRTPEQLATQVRLLGKHTFLVAAIKSAYRAAHREHLKGIDHEDGG
jgi:hypothetical protein